MTMLASPVDGLNYAEFDLPLYQPTYTDRWIRSMTFYHNLAFIQKGPNLESSSMLPPHPRTARHFAKAAAGPAVPAPRRALRRIVPRRLRRTLAGLAHSVEAAKERRRPPNARARDTRRARPSSRDGHDTRRPQGRDRRGQLQRPVLRADACCARSSGRPASPYEIVVVDNGAGSARASTGRAQRFLGRINRLALLDTNTYFAEGNNIGVAMAPRDATHVLLLNTDCEVARPALAPPHARGPLRRRHRPSVRDQRVRGRGPTGSACSVDRDSWEDGLDEAYQWWWSVTALEARLLRQGTVGPGRAGVRGRRGPPRRQEREGFQVDAKSGDTGDDVIRGWFDGRHVTVVERLPPAD